MSLYLVEIIEIKGNYQSGGLLLQKPVKQGFHGFHGSLILVSMEVKNKFNVPFRIHL